MDLRAVHDRLLRHVRAKVLRDAKQSLHGQRIVDLRQLHVIHLHKVRVRRGELYCKTHAIYTYIIAFGIDVNNSTKHFSRTKTAASSCTYISVS